MAENYQKKHITSSLYRHNVKYDIWFAHPLYSVWEMPGRDCG